MQKEHGYDSSFDIVDSLKAVRWLYLENLDHWFPLPKDQNLDLELDSGWLIHWNQIHNVVSQEVN